MSAGISWKSLSVPKSYQRGSVVYTYVCTLGKGGYKSVLEDLCHKITKK